MSTEPMSPKRLEGIRAREAAATPGPWESVVDNHGHGQVDVSVWSDTIGYYLVEKVASGSNHFADGAFIAGARSDVPDLVAEVDRLRTAMRLSFSPSLYLEIQEVLDKAHGSGEGDGAGAGVVADVWLLIEQRDRARAENERLRSGIADAIRDVDVQASWHQTLQQLIANQT
ncbi:hypothetical protein [Acrocarpospora sp. B8E8]|uniref:hypothetical protein n=1 Tax=Acrocarpospora sp. B8E8 TaxID=3153572 RepID=UPI00325DAF78